MLEKIAEGKLKKFYEEKTLLHQKFIKDEKKTIQDYTKANNVTIKGFCRFEIGT
jgi:elongation factor Ts